MINFIATQTTFIKSIPILAQAPVRRYGMARRRHLLIFSKQLPEVVNAVRVNEIGEQLLFKYQDKKFNESKLAFVDSTFFSIFDFKLLQRQCIRSRFPDHQFHYHNFIRSKKIFWRSMRQWVKYLATDQGNFTVSGVVRFP